MEEEDEELLPLVSIGNHTSTLDRLLNSSYYDAVGKRRMPQYVNAINRDSLKVLDDRCVTRDDARKAHAILKVVQARMQKFFLNAMPFASAYPHWNNLSTRRLVCDYMSKKIIITGGCGFIGSNFINYIYTTNKYNIINIDALYYCADKNNILPEIQESSQYVFIKGNLLSSFPLFLL